MISYRRSNRPPASVHAPWVLQLVFSEQNAEPQPACASNATASRAVTRTMRKTDMGTPGRKSAILWSSQREGNATCCRTPECLSALQVECCYQGGIPMKLDISASPAESRLKRLFWLRNV